MQGGPLSPLAVQWHVIPAEKLSTAQGGPLSPLAVQWHVVPAEKFSTAELLSPQAVQWQVAVHGRFEVIWEPVDDAQCTPLAVLSGISLLLRNSPLLKVGRSLLWLFSGTSFLFRRCSLSLARHVSAVSEARRSRCRALCLANRCSRASALCTILYPSLANGRVFLQYPKHDALAVELCPLPTAAPGPKSDTRAQFFQNP